MIPGIEQMEMR